METITEGSAVTCGMCGKATEVHFVTDRNGTPAYDLKCYHRNAICPTCGKLVKDASDDIREVVPACPDCNPEMFVDDETE
jgi:DNA-directed RNA polymerase subunit RPC12/RpoP